MAAPFVGPRADWDAYIARMQDREWGDHLTLLAVYRAFSRHAEQLSSSSSSGKKRKRDAEEEDEEEEVGGGGGGRKRNARKWRPRGRPEVLLKKWCKENFLSYRALSKAADIRAQLAEHCERMVRYLSRDILRS